MISLQNVSKSFADHRAVDDLSMELRPGEVTALIGPSGCGKSTVIRMIAGLIAPDRGSVEIDGTSMSEATAIELRRKMGYVIQDGGLFPHLTNRGNILLMAKHLGREAGAQEKRLADLCDLASFPREMLDRFPNEISGGQRQRVGLMRALMLEPEILLLDEPLGALDPLVRAKLQDDLKVIFRESGATVLLVTHDMGEAAYLADRIVLMRTGRIVQDGSAEAFRESPAEGYVTEFLQAQRGWSS